MKQEKKFSAARSRILLEVTALVLVIFIASVVVIGLVNYSSTKNLIQESKERLITTQGQDMLSSFSFSNKLILKILVAEIPGLLSQVPELTQAFMEKKPIAVQDSANKLIEEYIEQDSMGVELRAVALAAIPPTLPEPMIIISSDSDLIFTDLPESVQKIIDSDKGYAIVEEGIPEWGMEGEQLVVLTEEGEALTGGMVAVYSIGVKPIHDELESINTFYSDQQKQSSTVIIIVAFIALVVLLIVMFFVLSYLIKSRITKPIDELSEAAERVLEGDLDVQVPMKENEDFANLKRAFNEMITHIRDMVTRSTE